MSKYTTMVRCIVETYTYGSNKPIGDRILDACPKVFDFQFPMWDESHRLGLEGKILRHYFLREIGFETVGLWKLMLETKLNEIMPSYNIMYEQMAKGIGIFDTLDYWEDMHGKAEGSEDAVYAGKVGQKYSGASTDVSTQHGTVSNSGDSSTSNSSEQSGTSYMLDSDLPQINYSGVDYGTKQSDGRSSGETSSSGSQHDVASSTTNNAQSVTSSQDNAQETDTSSTNKVGRVNIDSRLRHIAGRQGGDSIAGLIMQYRNSLLNIDMMVVRDLNDLFIGLY